MTELKERRWELMEVGEVFGPIDLVVGEPLIRTFVYAVDDFDPRYLFDGPGVERVTPPTLLCREARDVIRTIYDITSGGAGMHTKHAVEIHACARPGGRVRITGRHADKYLKREKQYIVLESEVHDESGRLLLRQRSTHIRALRPGVAKAPSASGPYAAPDADAIASTPAELRIGGSLQPLAKRPSQEQLTAFAGTEWRNIHNDADVARSSGLPATVASGLQTTAYVSELMGRYCGDGWRCGGALDVAFTAPLTVDTLVYVGGRVADIVSVDGRDRLQVEVWCVTESGTQVLAGTASAWLGPVRQR